MMTGIIPGEIKRARWLWPAVTLFLFVVLAVVAWNRNLAKESPDLLSVAERTWLKAHPVIRLAPDPDFPPVEYFAGNGGYRGITADYVALIENKLGIRIEIVRLRNWDEIISKAKSRQIDAYVATKTPQRSEYMLFTKPFLEFPVVIIAREAEAPLSLEKLNGMKVSVVSEYAAHNFIAYKYPKLNLDLVPDVETGLRKVAFGLSDAFVENLATATYYIEKEGIANLRIAGESGYFYRMGFCTRKDWPELNLILEKGLAGISSDEKSAIYKKWIPLEARSRFSSREFQAGIIVAVAAILLIVAGVIAWNRVLVRQVSRRTEELENELSERKRMEEELFHAHDDLEKKVEERTAELRSANELLEREIAVRNRTESVNMARLRLLQFAGTCGMDELLEATLDEAEALTGSCIGFYVFLHEDQKTLSLQNWSTRTKREYCKAEVKGLHYDVSQAGVWVDCVQQRRPVIHNDYASLPHRKGLPPNHAPLIRELVVPVFRGENIVAIIAVGNKPTDYTSQDVEVVSLLADLAWEITERKQAEELLRKSEAAQRKLACELAQKNNFLRTLIDAIPDLISYKDCNRAYLGCNRAFEAFAGRPEKELVSRTDLDIFSRDVADAFREMDMEILSTEESRRNEEWIDYPDGRRVLLETLKTPFFDLDGEILGVVGISRDITKRKSMEEELLLSHFCINEAAIGIIQVSLDDGKILRVNYSACRSLGYSSDELCAMSIFDIEPSFTLEQFADLKRIVDQSGSMTFETVARRKDGTLFPVEITVNNLEFHGVSTGFSFFRDISERKRAEEALRESESRVRRKLESILDPEGDTAELDLADILDAPHIQSLMDDLYQVTGLKMSIIDLKGRVLVDVGWKDICTRFHRNHPETLKKCLESDSDLTVGVPQGEFRTYRCKNNMWHIVTPIIVGGRHMGNLFLGQFFFAGEQIDYDLFRSQARAYGFPEEEYIAALEAVPRHSEDLVDLGKAVFLRLTDMFSKLSYTNIKLAHSLAERDRLTATLREANLVVENSPAVLFRWKGDDEWPVELVSGNIIQFGYTPEEFLSGAITYSSIIHPDDLERVTREVHDFCDGGADQFRLEYRIMTKGGDVRWVNEHTNVERDAAGGVNNFEGIVIDVTERKLAEEELQRQKKLLQELNESLEKRVGKEVAKNREKDIMLIQQNRQAALGEMLEHIAHQWKQPLTSLSLVIQDLGETASSGELTDANVKETVSITMSLLDHMVQTMNIFRGFYRPDKEKKVFSIKDSIDQALAFIAPALSFHSIAVELDVDPGLTAFGYPKEYTQVLLNILANARDVFRKRGTEKPRVMIRAFAEVSKSVVTVTDNAGGIPEAIIGRIFDFYFTTNESDGGTGIGLYMSKNIMEKNMSGTLRAENTDGGARFRIEISTT